VYKRETQISSFPTMSNYYTHPSIIFKHHNFIDVKTCANEFSVGLKLEKTSNLTHIKSTLEIDDYAALITFINVKDSEKYTFECVYRDGPPKAESGSGTVVFDLDLKNFVCATSIKSNKRCFRREGKEISFKNIMEKECVRIKLDLNYLDNECDGSDDEEQMSPAVSGKLTYSTIDKSYVIE
jgi:hypothetical protein